MGLSVGRRQAIKEDQERSEAEMRSGAYHSASTKEDDSQKIKIVFTEMEEFVWISRHSEDFSTAPGASDQERKDKDTGHHENPVNEIEENTVPDRTIHDVPIGKGLCGALNLLKDRGTLKESVECGGRNVDKKKRELGGIMDSHVDSYKFKDIQADRTDEFGRVMTPKEDFRMLSHRFHGKHPGKRKQEKRRKQYLQDLKLKKMKNLETPSLSAGRMREALAQQKMPYLVHSGHL